MISQTAENEAKLDIIRQINEAIYAIEDKEIRTALSKMLSSPELELEIVEKANYINYANLGCKGDAEDRILARDERHWAHPSWG